jgi:hypothetical protein
LYEDYVANIIDINPELEFTAQLSGTRKIVIKKCRTFLAVKLLVLLVFIREALVYNLDAEASYQTEYFRDCPEFVCQHSMAIH